MGSALYLFLTGVDACKQGRCVGMLTTPNTTRKASSVTPEPMLNYILDYYSKLIFLCQVTAIHFWCFPTFVSFSLFKPHPFMAATRISYNTLYSYNRELGTVRANQEVN